MELRPKTLVAALALALGSSNAVLAAPLSNMLYSAGIEKYLLKRSDGTALYYGHPTFANNYLGGLPSPNTGCTSSHCNWKLISTPEGKAIDLGIVGWGGVKSTSIGSASVPVDKIVSASYQASGSDTSGGIVWFLSGGRLKAVKNLYSPFAGSFTAIVPTADNSAFDIAAINATGQISSAMVVVSGRDPIGVYFTTSTGSLYYYGKKPTYIKVGADVIGDDTVAATNPVLLRSDVNGIFASHNSNYTEGYKLGYVATDGNAYVYSATSGVAPANISSNLGMGKISSVHTFVHGGGGADTVFGAENGVYAELKSSTGVLVSNGYTGTGTFAKPQLVPGLTADKIANGVQFGGYGGGNAVKTVYYTDGGSLMGFGGGANQNPVGAATLTPVPIYLTDPNWKATLSATKDTVAQKVNVSITPPSGAVSLRLFRATGPTSAGQLIAEVPGTTTSFTDTPPDGNLYYYYAEGLDAEDRNGPKSTPVEGRANVAPTQVVANGSVDNSGSVTITPAIIDPNAGDTFTLDIFAAPLHGTATVVNGNQVEYKSMNPQFTGNDTFKLRVTDQLGNSTTSAVSIAVNCTAPSLLGQSQDTVVEYGSGVIRVEYQAQPCHANLTAKLELLDPVSGAPVFSESTQTIGGSGNHSLSFVVKDLPAKNYPARISFSSQTLAAQVLNTPTPVNVSRITPPVLAVAKTTWGEDEKATVSLSMPTGSNCPLTTDEAIAKSNLAYCLAEAITIPLGLSLENVPGFLKVSGFGMPKTNTPFAYQMSKWDSQGQKHVVLQDLTTLSFLEAPPPTFEIFSQGTNVVAVRDLVATELRQTSGAPCTVYPNQIAAQDAVAAGKRACLATFSPPAGGMFEFDGNLNTFKGRFQAGQVGAKNFGYKIQRLYLDKPTLTITEGNLAFNVTDFATAPAFAVALNKDKVIRGIDTVQASVARTAGEMCVQSSNADEVAASWYAPGVPKCLVTWGALPGGMSASGVLATGKIAAPGTFNVPATVSFLNPSKGVEFTSSIEQSLTASLPQGPQFTFDATPAIPGTDIYPVGENGLVGKLTIGDDSLGGVSLSIDSGAAAPEVHRQLQHGVVRNVSVTPVALWTRRNITLKTLWDDFPDISNSITIQSVELPPPGMQAGIILPKSIVSTMPIEVQVSLGLTSNTGLRYSEARMGNWMGFLGALQADGTIAQLTTPVLIEGGKATLVYPKAGELNNAQIVFVADVQSGTEGYSNRIVSKPSKISVADGTSIIPIVRSDFASGAAPLRVKLKAEVQPEQAKNLRRTEWLISNDGGKTWSAVEKANGSSINYIFKEKGKYQVKTMTTNKYSNDVGYSEPFEITVYELPEMQVDGISVVRAGTTATLKIVANAASYKWVAEKSDGSKITSDTADLVLDSALPQVVKVTAYASNETGETLNDPAAWNMKKSEIRFINLTPVRVSVSGSKTIEVGKEMELAAAIKTDWNNELANLELLGRWEIPGGAVVEGLTARWTPTSQDYAEQKAPTFFGWVKGFESLTIASITPKIGVREYIWPAWKMEDRPSVMQAPALVRLAVTASKEELKQFSSAKGTVKYTWSFPDNATGVRVNGSSANFSAQFPGEYIVRVDLEDSRENKTTLEYKVLVSEAKNMESEIKTTSSNKYNRAPLSVQIKPTFFKGHPKEKVTSYKFFRDGQLLEENSKGRYIDLLEQAGEYTLSVEATTSLDRTFNTETKVSVVDNKPPVCSLSKKEYKSTVTVTANCKDQDGRIEDYSWAVDGVPVSNKGYRISVPFGSSIELRATDDAGASVTLTGKS